MLRRIFTSEGYEFHEVYSKEAALIDLVRSKHPDLVLLDSWHAGVPGGGLDVLQEFAADPELAGVPVLFCSSDSPAFDKTVEGVRFAQRVAVIRRPFDIDELLQRTRELLDRSDPDSSASG
jgi:DNA-binding response OmpR family regulator